MSEPPRWWTVRAAQNLKPATYRCPFCDELLPALSEHVLVTPEGDARRRRHAIRRARSPSARPAGCPRATSGCGRSRHNLARSGVFSVGSAAGAERIKTDSQLVVLTGTWAASMAPSTGPTCCRGVSARRRPSSSRPRRSSPRSTSRSISRCWTTPLARVPSSSEPAAGDMPRTWPPTPAARSAGRQASLTLSRRTTQTARHVPRPRARATA
jgi:hypothetical protein